jgi:thiamine pyrophosphate-dependent acetolactate synthase large subunit-like protein
VISVADLVVRHLGDAGVRSLFGMPGGGSNLDPLAAAGRAGVSFVLTATETAGALAQAEISGAPGACLTTLGPGVAAVVNGAACARLDRAPLLVFTDSHPSASGGISEHQRLDHQALLGPVTKWSATLSAENADAVLREAVERAMTEPRGPVHIECPADVLSATVGARAFQRAIAIGRGRPNASPSHRKWNAFSVPHADRCCSSVSARGDRWTPRRFGRCAPVTICRQWSRG